jgi:pimeloyl-ACP methyl ester carboxylesterase
MSSAEKNGREIFAQRILCAGDCPNLGVVDSAWGIRFPFVSNLPWRTSRPALCRSFKAICPSFKFDAICPSFKVMRWLTEGLVKLSPQRRGFPEVLTPSRLLVETARPLRRWPLAAVPFLVCFLLVVPWFAFGCAYTKQVTIRAHSPSPWDRMKTLWSEEKPSERTQQFLRRYGLAESWRREEPRAFLRRIQDLVYRDPSDDKLFAASELAYLAAGSVEKENPRLALDLYGASVIHAFQYLFDDRFRDFRNPYDPQFRGACDLYNVSLERMLRLVCREHGLSPGRMYELRTASGIWELSCRIGAGLWRPEEFGRFEFATDYEIRNLRNHYRNYGLGVPLIAVRRPLPVEPPEARYYPDNLSFPVTVFLRPEADADPYASDTLRRRSASLELYDPIVTSDIRVGNLWVPLQTDLSTPLAYFLADPRMLLIPTVGLLRPEKLLTFEPRRGKPLMGLYMLQPYERGKIPVVMIHGLWSGPMTWMEMFNDLRSLPEIRQHFQFWFYLYPTAQPFWISAAALREELAEVRQVLDPSHQESALDQMVLVGHSMGGLLARLQTVESKDNFWRVLSDVPFELVRSNPAERSRLQKIFFFQPNASIRRVIFIGTPHRGSRASNLTTQWILERLIRLPEFVVSNQTEFLRANRDLIRDEKVVRIDTSVEALSPGSPFFAALESCPKAPWVKWHNIVGILPEKGLVGRLAAGSDGVVRYTSAHVEDADSELIVPADHLTIHTHPETIQEVRRILLEHLAEVTGSPIRPPTYFPVAQGVYPAGYSGQGFSAVRSAGFPGPGDAEVILPSSSWYSGWATPLLPAGAGVELPAGLGGRPLHPVDPFIFGGSLPVASPKEGLPLAESLEEGIPWAVGYDPIRR